MTTRFVDLLLYFTSILACPKREFIANLKVVRAAASNTKKAIELFQAIDTDGSGQLDVPEFSQLLRGIGLTLGEEQIHEIFDKYDVDDSKYSYLLLVFEVESLL